MGWRRISINIRQEEGNSVILCKGDIVEISTRPVTQDTLVCYKKYVYQDEYGNHLCIKDPNPYHEGNLHMFIGISSNHFGLCNLNQIFELRDTTDPLEYQFKEINVQDLRYSTGVSPKKMEELSKLRKGGWKIVSKDGNNYILERKKRLSK